MTAYDEATGETFQDVFDAIEPNKQLAAEMRLRATLMIDIEREVKSWGLTQKEAALKLGISQPRLNDLLRSKMSVFSIGNLITIAEKAGLHYEISLKKAA